jgi:hypothetical protein
MGLDRAESNPRLAYAYADLLLKASRNQEALSWFITSANADVDEETDAIERVEQLSGEVTAVPAGPETVSHGLSGRANDQEPVADDSSGSDFATDDHPGASRSTAGGDKSAETADSDETAETADSDETAETADSDEAADTADSDETAETAAGPNTATDPDTERGVSDIPMPVFSDDVLDGELFSDEPLTGDR